MGIDPKCCAVSEMCGHWHVEGICTLGWLKFLQAEGGGLTMHERLSNWNGKASPRRGFEHGIMGVHGNPNCRRKTKNLQGLINCLKILSRCKSKFNSWQPLAFHIFPPISAISVFMKLWNPWHFFNFLIPPPQPYHQYQLYK